MLAEACEGGGGDTNHLLDALQGVLVLRSDALDSIRVVDDDVLEHDNLFLVPPARHSRTPSAHFFGRIEARLTSAPRHQKSPVLPCSLQHPYLRHARSRRGPPPSPALLALPAARAQSGAPRLRTVCYRAAAVKALVPLHLSEMRSSKCGNPVQGARALRSGSARVWM